MIRRVFSPLASLVLIFSFFACEEQLDLTPSIITENALLVSGERMRLSGRVITTQNIAASDHGFYISDNEGFSQPIIISLGVRESPGRFIGETTGLEIEKTYFVKSFAELPEGIVFGNVVNIETLSPRLIDFSPSNGQSGITVTINGVNITEDVRVFFGDNEAEVLGVDFESILRVRVPPIGNRSTVPVKVFIQNKELNFTSDFDYSTGIYTKIFEFPGSLKFAESISLQEGGVFYAGMGTDQSSMLNNTFWKYTHGQSEWTQVPLPSRTLRRAFSSKSYYGGGSALFFPFVQAGDFVRLQNGSFEVLPELPFNFINGKGFELNSKLFLVGGDEGSGRDVYMYDPESAEWMELGNAPYRILNSHFSFEYEGSQYFINPETRDVTRFNPEGPSWSIISNYPGELGNNGTGFAVSIGDKAYLGIGNRSSQVWEFNMNNLEWIRKNDFTGSSLARVVGTYVFNEDIYILRSPESQVGGSIEFWKFEPNSF
ncbi:MAG: IPT/TIG domain protein [Mongoliibacter sp.]|uniref:IPT/TIG domain-containing protein n=1 Tax=Mongoliibacter sp. TaxID=2022438 RepID=UPI0012F077A5|nr:IPT/TIG domain-containing protein [Mongoliibacter sp.]TVP49855.1 MAG: IPT/TIG domain protein [Mongoliibacter sp.]